MSESARLAKDYGVVSETRAGAVDQIRRWQGTAHTGRPHPAFCESPSARTVMNATSGLGEESCAFVCLYVYRYSVHIHA